MGAVYRAYDTKLRRQVALKVLAPERLADAESKQRLIREARAASALNHPNIVTVHEIGSGVPACGPGVDFIAMELVEGKSLKDAISAKGLPLPKALDYAAQIAAGLAKAHAAGIIHRDLKPGNVMVTPDGLVKLLDFGLARRQRLGESETTLTTEGMIAGTLAYMPPEQAEGRAADARSDIFSFGAVLYEMLTGRQAFEGKSQAGLIAAIMEKNPPSVSSVQPTSPPALDRVVRKCLEKDPDRRWQSAADLRDELQWVAETAGHPEGPGPSGFARRPWVRRRVTLGLAAAIALVFAAIFVWWLSRSSTGTDSSMRPVSRWVFKIPEGVIEEGAGGALTFSPDGAKLVYTAVRAGTWQLYLRRLDQLQATAIPGTEGESSPFFSPDGNWVGFFAGGKLKKVSLAGEAPLTICETGTGRGLGGSWAPDGTIVFAPGQPFGLMRVSANGGTPVALTTPDPRQGEMAHIWPEVLPGGEAVLFTILRAGLGFGDHPIAIFSLKSGERRILSRDFTFVRYAATGHLVCYREGSVAALPFDLKRLRIAGPPVNLLEGVARVGSGVERVAPVLGLSGSGSLAFVKEDPKARTSRFVWVSQAGAAQPLAVPEQEEEFPALSPDGRLLAMTVTNQQGSHIWLWDLQRDTLNRLTYEGDNHAPIWSPDGQWVVFSSNQQGPESNLYRRRADGTGPAERLLSSVNHQDPGSFSPDGKLLAFAEFGGESKWDIWVLAMDGARAARPFLQTKFSEQEPMISPDGRWIAYSSDESGRSEVYVQPFPQGGRKWQISNEGANQPLWAPDGRRLFFRTPDSVVDVAIETRPEFVVGKRDVLFSGYYRGRTGFGHPNYEISRDGQRFLMLQPSLPQGTGATEINVVLNWSEELKGLVRPQNRAGK